MRKRILSFIRGRAMLVGAMGLLAVLALPMVTASASIPNTVTGAITGCVKNQGGAVRIIDAQAGAVCATDERTVNWPGVGGAATQYFLPSAVNLSHDAGQLTTVITGPVLPAGIWNATASVTVVNNTGQRDTLRCGLFTGGGSLISGIADNHGEAIAMTVPGLVTFASPDRINVACSHDHPLPAGLLAVIHGVVVAEQMTSRF